MNKNGGSQLERSSIGCQIGGFLRAIRSHGSRVDAIHGQATTGAQELGLHGDGTIIEVLMEM